MCAGEQEGVQGVGNCAGIAEVRLLEASVTLSALGDSLDKGFTPLDQPDLPRKNLSDWTGWQAPSHTKPSSQAPAQLGRLSWGSGGVGVGGEPSRNGEAGGGGG